MDNTEPKTRRKARAIAAAINAAHAQGLCYRPPPQTGNGRTDGVHIAPPKQTLPQPAAWQKREPPMQVILRRLKEYERRLKRIISMCDNVSIGLIADAAVDLTLIKEIAEGKHDRK
jgi:hypothetical protein